MGSICAELRKFPKRHSRLILVHSMFHGVSPKYANAFLRSALALESEYADLDSVIHWLAELNSNTYSEINRIPFSEMRGWSYNKNTGSIEHDSGKFFSIDGYHIESSWGKYSTWEQPLINQAEVGYLGFIVQEFGGVLHFLMQAKIEPGNSNVFQLSPTLQATRSNYTRIHKGRAPHYLEYFKQASPPQILLDQLQSEQGSRFLAKRNRNMIVKVDEPIEMQENFRWLTLGQLKVLMGHHNLINMDSRTVVSGIHFGIGCGCEELVSKASGEHASILRSALQPNNGIHTYEEILSQLTHLKSTQDVHLKKVPLTDLEDWTFHNTSISHDWGAYFKVIAVDVKIAGREVQSWTQPMIEPAQRGLCAFICKEIDGMLHFIVQLKMECGNRDVFEFAPTVQALEGHDKNGTPIDKNPFEAYVLNAAPDQMLFDALQAEEGGRFYRDNNRNCIVKAGVDFSEELPDSFIWMSLNQIYGLTRANNIFNIQARSLIAAIRFV